MNIRPLRSELESQIGSAKAAFTAAAAAVVAGQPNAQEHAWLALQRLTKARQALAQLDEAQPAMEAR